MTFDLDLYFQGHSTLIWSCPLCNVFSSRSIIFFTWDPIWLNSVGYHDAAGRDPKNAGVLVVLVYNNLITYPCSKSGAGLCPKLGADLSHVILAHGLVQFQAVVWGAHAP